MQSADVGLKEEASQSRRRVTHLSTCPSPLLAFESSLMVGGGSDTEGISSIVASTTIITSYCSGWELKGAISTPLKWGLAAELISSQ